MAALDDLLAEARRKMDKTVEATRHEFNTVRTGRASAALLDRIQVNYYGSKMPVNQVAHGQRAGAAPALDHALRPERDQGHRARHPGERPGLTPANDGKIIRLQIPQLTEERRKDLVKVVRHLAEEGRVAVRNVRRDAISHMKALEKDGDVSGTTCTARRTRCRSSPTSTSSRSRTC